MSNKKKYSKYISEVDIEYNDYRTKIEYDDTDYMVFLINIFKRRKFEIKRCPGCFPVFQFNQLGHIGENGCLGDYCDFID